MPPERVDGWEQQLPLCVDCTARLCVSLASHFAPPVAGHQLSPELAAVRNYSELTVAAVRDALLGVGGLQAPLAHPLQPQTAALEGRQVAEGLLALQEPAAALAAVTVVAAVNEARQHAWLHGASARQCGVPAHPSGLLTTRCSVRVIRVPPYKIQHNGSHLH